MNSFKVSVIIPVFNAEKFIEKALTSVLIQDEVDEVLLIDDGSKDNSYTLIQKLALENNRIKVLSHPKRINKGPAATRNLGIINAKNEWIAFLDADDYFLEDRFKKTIDVIENNLNCDGIYEAIAPEEDTNNPSSNKIISYEFISVTSKVAPENLFFSMSPIGRYGNFSGDGLTIKKSKLLECNLFDTDLRIGEDVLLWLKLSIASNLYAGSIEAPVSKFLRHSGNTTFGGDVAHHLIPVFKKLLTWPHQNLTQLHKNTICDRLLFAVFNYSNENFIRTIFYILSKNPKFLFSNFFSNNFKYWIKTFL